ncbi:MAG TPA: CGNR zinc finger domain-containing protein [Sphingomicrobium sp.]|nr:CGNR zinc finger domain-containing protein [Sphingomicrobium sp.]
MGETTCDLPELLGGRLCLDFVNTIHHRFRPVSRDHLRDYGSWLRWCAHAGALSSDEADQLATLARSGPGLGERAFDRVLVFRTTAHRIVTEHMAVGGATEDLVTQLNELLILSAPLRHIAPASGSYWRWSWRDRPLNLDRPLYAVARSLADLLATAPRERLKECPAPDGCGWLFLDETRNGSRRWCSMNHCGTTSKVRRYLGRKREAAATTDLAVREA